MSTTARIVRSSGVYPGRHWTGPWPGGGGVGLTRALDHRVQLAAEALVRRFGVRIVIRFNADQLSGGAWISNPKFGRTNSDVGITCRLADNNQVFMFVYAIIPACKNVKESRYRVQTFEKTGNHPGCHEVAVNSVKAAMLWINTHVSPAYLDPRVLGTVNGKVHRD